MRVWLLLLLLCGLASAHTVDYQIDGKQAVVVTVRLAEEPAGYSEYDLATTPAPVLSSRRLLVAALSLPKAQRVDALRSR